MKVRISVQFGRRMSLLKFRLLNLGKEAFTCPVCSYHGPFHDLAAETGVRKHASCPFCGARERHRLQHLVVRELFPGTVRRDMRMLHVAPEPFFKEYFSHLFTHYETADLVEEDVDHRIDIQRIPFPDSVFDIVYASHVLEHVSNDLQALREISRILRPGGIAILPVPLVADITVEYTQPNPHEAYHVRAPGYDYYERYDPFFSRIIKYSSASFSSSHQLFVYEDRTVWPNNFCPERPPMIGEKHLDVIPVCFK